jgi:predicted ATP-dependent endonuclease of OLD family
MRLIKAVIHNVRSISQVEIDFDNYALLVGENNVGKTNILIALRLFYEDNVKFDQKSDFPKFETDDNESWVELHFLTTLEEQSGLKKEYHSSDNILRVRRYFLSGTSEMVKTSQSNIYAYEYGKLSANLFYGAKNISQAKLGRIIYIPEISKTDETMKLSGPSPFREIINFLMKKVVSQSKCFTSLENAFTTFNDEFRKESDEEGFSLQTLINDINTSVEDWRVNFGVNVNAIRSEDIVKNLLSPYFQDLNLNKQNVSISSFGQGLQRHIIYTLLRLSTKYEDKKTSKKKDFQPDFTLILFEEPEAFLHPSQQEQLNISLKKLSEDNQQQIVATTHSSIFVSKNTSDLTSLIKLHKKNDGKTLSFQLDNSDLSNIYDANLSLFKKFSDLLKDVTTSKELKEKIINKKLGQETADEDLMLQEESVKYFLWLDSERSSLFFAKQIILCEGASEKIFLDFLTNNFWPDLRRKHLYYLDCMGKYNIHRYMNLLGKLRIAHAVIMDKDENEDVHQVLNDFIHANKNSYTKDIFTFEKDFETFLEIERSRRPDLKPLNVLHNYHAKKISETKVSELKSMVDSLLSV